MQPFKDKEFKELIVINPIGKVKSAELVVYDDSRNVIPLSKRFDTGSRDIRYMPQGEPKATRANQRQPKRSEARYRNPALAKSISLAISGQSQERDQNK